MDLTMALQCRNEVVLGIRVRGQVGGRRSRAVMIAASRCGGGPPAAVDRDYFNESALSTPLGSGSGKSRKGWRVYSSTNGLTGGHRGEDFATSLYATVEKANDIEGTKNLTQRFGSSEAFCDEESSFLAVESVLEDEGGKSVEDYKLRARIFSESAVFFSALKDRDSHSAVDK